jgi:peptidoglycan/xylan/chitin deacetylase (PgdA/CDA1 family)
MKKLSILIAALLVLSVVVGGCASKKTKSEAESTPPTPAPNGSGVVIFVMDDVLQVGAPEDIAAAVTQVNMDENVDLVLNVIPWQISSASVIAPKLQDWNNTEQGLIEIAQHGWDHSEYMANLSYTQQKALVQNGLNEFSRLGISPKCYTPPFGSQNANTLQVLGDLGFHTDFDWYVGLNSTSRIVVLNQSLAQLSKVPDTYGPEVNFKSADALMNDMNNAVGTYGYAVVGFHQQDFETMNSDLDTLKLAKYRQILQTLKSSGRYQFMTAEEYYQTLRPLVPTPSPTPTPKLVTTPVAGQKYAGVRASSYGITPFPSTAGWSNAVKTMSSYWPGSTPTTIWLVGEILPGSNDCGLQFPNPTPEATYPHIAFEDVGINHEEYLSFFDSAGVKVLLSVEPGDADIPTLIDLVLNQFGHHQCVIGVGIDVEWNLNSRNSAGVAVTDAQAQAWEAKAKSYNSAYRLFLKHWLVDRMPPTYRGNIIFVDDGQGFSSLNGMLSEFANNWAAVFPSDTVFFQVGYESDQSWWGTLAYPPGDIGNAIFGAIAQDCGVFWVDFTLRDVLPTGP